MVPDNEMPFEGIKDSAVRADLLAFLKDATKPGAPQQTAQQGGMKGMGGMGGMGGMMGGGQDQNLRKLEPGIQVKAITYCHDTYRVTTGDGKTRAFWERNLRFKTDSSKDGPENGCTGNLAGRNDGRQSFGDFRRTGGNHQDDRSSMLSRAFVAECLVDIA